MGRRREMIPSSEELRLDLGARRSILQRTLLEAVPLDSAAMHRHQSRLFAIAKRGGGLAERVAAYERTIEELGLSSRYAELVQRRNSAKRV